MLIAQVQTASELGRYCFHLLARGVARNFFPQRRSYAILTCALDQNGPRRHRCRKTTGTLAALVDPIPRNRAPDFSHLSRASVASKLKTEAFYIL